MTTKEDMNLEGYKEKVKTTAKGFLFWDKELIFRGMTQSGYEIEFDAQVQWGCMPTESLMLSLAGCMGIDVVSFLQKMKVELHKFKLDIEGERNPTPPQYYKSFTMHLHLTGKGIKEKQVERAIALSQEKYCSVYHSLRKDLTVKVGYTITDVEEPHIVK
ncbi:MAG: OsmC family protein [Nitrospirae bacterium]|nr:OsmC family protein [Nitrospirota bacterium]MBI5694592.1 OsmC family protein [Nitrospirota bacterium]